MAVFTDLVQPLKTVPLPVLIFATPLIFVLGLLSLVRLYTSLRYRRSLRAPNISFEKEPIAVAPSKIPYTIPFLGQARDWLSTQPGGFWQKLFKLHPRNTGACTLYLGGETIHILFSQSAVQALLKDRTTGRDGFNMRIEELGLGASRSDVQKYEGIGQGPDESGITPKQRQEKMDHRFMMEKKHVDELTGKFMECFRHELSHEAAQMDDQGDQIVSLNKWLISQMFPASTTALFGSRILEVYPELKVDFFEFDRVILSLFFGLPRFLNRKAYAVRDKALDGLRRWQEAVIEESKGEPPLEPDGEISWEPVWGSRFSRAKQRYYAAQGIAVPSRAAFDLGFLFALNSNAIPAAGWMLLHILDPKGDHTLLPRLMLELEPTKKSDGSLDVSTLVGLPLLQAVLHEVLRLYVDILFTRENTQDLKLPHDNGKQSILLGKNSVIMAPTWLGHRDEKLWADPPCSQFSADRWLHTDSETGKQVFSTNGTAGKFFPFGGGRTMCPGRNFAKQEILASVATVLTTFDITPLSYLDEHGRATEKFPTMRNGLLGSGTMATDEDMKVRLRRKENT